MVNIPLFTGFQHHVRWLFGISSINSSKVDISGLCNRNCWKGKETCAEGIHCKDCFISEPNFMLFKPFIMYTSLPSKNICPQNGWLEYLTWAKSGPQKWHTNFESLFILYSFTYNVVIYIYDHIRIYGYRKWIWIWHDTTTLHNLGLYFPPSEAYLSANCL